MPDGDAGFVEIEARVEPDELFVDVDGFEGPLDLLLQLARHQKVDLRKISVLASGRAVPSFHRAREDPQNRACGRLSGPGGLADLSEVPIAPASRSGRRGSVRRGTAAHLAFQLERLAAMRDAASKLMARDQKGRDFFVRGIPEDVTRVRRVRYTASLLDLMQGYARFAPETSFARSRSYGNT